MGVGCAGRDVGKTENLQGCRVRGVNRGVGKKRVGKGVRKGEWAGVLGGGCCA